MTAATLLETHSGSALTLRLIGIALLTGIILAAAVLLTRRDARIVAAAATVQQHEVTDTESRVKVLQVLQSVSDLGKVVVCWNSRGQIIYSSAGAASVLGIQPTETPQNISEIEHLLQDITKGGDWQAEFLRARISPRHEKYPVITVRHHTSGLPCELRPSVHWMLDHQILIADILTVNGRPHPLADLLQRSRPPE